MVIMVITTCITDQSSAIVVVIIIPNTIGRSLVYPGGACWLDVAVLVAAAAAAVGPFCCDCCCCCGPGSADSLSSRDNEGCVAGVPPACRPLAAVAASLAK